MKALGDNLLAEAVEAVGKGEVIGVPTETVYGIAVSPFLKEATERVFAVKKRPETSPLPLLLAEPEEAALFGELDDQARLLIERHWPGPLTIVVARRPGSGLELGGDEATVGLRCPDQPTTRALMALTGPLAVTSANRHGEAPAETAEEFRASLGDAVRVILDGGVCNGMPSTVVSLLGKSPVILRQGAIPLSEL